MPKLIIFDLDGVLVDSCDVHYNSLNKALAEHGLDVITPSDHQTKFNGLSTRMKLMYLGIDPELVEKVYSSKQRITHEFFQLLKPSERLQKLLRGLKDKNIKTACASNCIRETVQLVLNRLGIYELFDVILSNEDVVNPKPSPEIYTRIMDICNISPSDTLIFEDSYVGLQSATASKANVYCVRNPNELTFEYVVSAKPNLTKHVNIVIPMAGNGSRFVNAGYTDPKPFIRVFGKPMISWVVDNLGVDATYTFIIRKDFENSYNAHDYLTSICPGCNIVSVDRTTEGAACTVLLAKDYIDNNNPLIIINSDQYIEFDSFKFIFDFLYSPNESKFDGKISTFDGKRHPKWSYAKVDTNNVVTEVREKDPFSDHATTGLYMWRRGSDFVKYANQMITKNIRVNNEFYVVPVFNEAIEDGLAFTISDCDRMWGIGVPEDLDFFVQNFNNNVK